MKNFLLKTNGLLFAVYLLVSWRPIWALPPTQYDVLSTEPHTIELITSGTYALKSYLECIRSAHSSIILEAFSINNDTSTQLIMDALIKKKKKTQK